MKLSVPLPLLVAAPLILQGSVMAAPTKVLFDTDTAYFLDDGAALVMLLQRPEEVDVLGVTVTSGNLWAKQGAEYMLHILELMDRTDVPLLIGAQMPLVNTPERAKFQQESLGGVTYLGAFDDPPPADHELDPPFGGAFSATRPQQQDAVSFIIETIDQHPGEITFLALGPLTNLAMALNLRPDLAEKIQSLVFMGGALRVPGNTSPYAEFNFWFDPEAAQQVFRSKIPEKVMFGLDITNHAELHKSTFDAITAVDTPVTRLMVEDDRRRSWGFAANPDGMSYVWDCLAAAYLIDPSFVTKEELVAVDVDSALGPSYGASYEPSGPPPEGLLPTRVQLDLDVESFFDLYVELLTTWKGE